MNYPWFKPSHNYNLKKGINLNFKSNRLTFGKKSLELEKKIKKILGVKHVVLTTSGTSALMMAYLALYKKSDKVLASDTNWVASLNPAKILNLNINLVDTSYRSLKTNFNLLNNKIKRLKPNIVLLTHLNGSPNYNKDFDKLKKKYKFKVIEDAAQSFLINSREKKKYIGTVYEIGCFSLGITKLVHMVYGGFCATNSDIIAKKLFSIRNNGLSSLPDNYILQASSTTGLNFKPSDLHSNLGLKNFKSKNSNLIRLNQIYKIYKDNLDNKDLEFVAKETEESLPLYNHVLVENKLKFIKYCSKNKIEVHTGFRAIHENTPFKNKTSKFINSSYVSKHFIRIPSGPGYQLNEIKNICLILNRYKN
jgi:dTDP-4-amino-4,6-dideoxygalactose transaminase